mgnify:FL=1
MTNLESIKAEHNQLLLELKRTLVDIGVPEHAIAVNMVIRLQSGRRQDADLILLGNDGKTIVAQFEIKIGRDPFHSACMALRDMPNRHKCYVVTNKDGISLIAAIDRTGNPKWVKLSDETAIMDLVGDYEIEANKAVASAEEAKQKALFDEWNWFRWIVCVVGIIFVFVTGTCEWHGHEFSWKVYSLLFLVFAMVALTSGYAVHVKVGENEISVEKGSQKE